MDWLGLWLVMVFFLFFFFMIRRPPRSTLSSSSAASDVYKRQSEKIAEAIQEKGVNLHLGEAVVAIEQQGGRVHAIQTSKQRYETDAVLFANRIHPEYWFLGWTT